jgi:hypothetical protein
MTAVVSMLPLLLGAAVVVTGAAVDIAALASRRFRAWLTGDMS